jgi:hypothetical protein
MMRGLQKNQVREDLLRESALGRQKSSGRVEWCFGAAMEDELTGADGPMTQRRVPCWEVFWVGETCRVKPDDVGKPL